MIQPLKILHTADWHLGKRLDRFSRLDEQKEVLSEIIALADAHAVDLVVVSGDVYDTYNPSAEAEDLLYQSLKALCKGGTRPVVVVAGNHDNPERLEASRPLASELGIFILGFPHSEVITTPCVQLKAPGFMELHYPGWAHPVRLILTPYANEYRLKAYLGSEDKDQGLRELLEQQWTALAEQFFDDKGINMLSAHLYVSKEGSEAPQEDDGEKPINHVGGAPAVYSKHFPKGTQYVALGHLHRMHSVGGGPCAVYYSGSPLAYSMAEAGQQKYVLILEAAPAKEIAVTPIALQHGKPTMKLKAKGLAEALELLAQHTHCWVDLELHLDAYLTSGDRQALNQAHEGIVNIFPVITHEVEQTEAAHRDMNLPIEALFKQYFTHKKSSPPDEAMMELFREVLAVNLNEDNDATAVS